MKRFAYEYGAFEIGSLPGQSQVAICHSLMVPEKKRGQGFGHKLKSLQGKELHQLMYDYAICTVAATNLAQKKVLTKAGWTKLAEFRNRRSCETTELWGAAQ